MKFLKYYFVPSLLIAVFCFHVFQVQKGLNKWKGGGFGMYSDYHVFYYDLEINGKSFSKNKNLRNDRTIRNFLYQPTKTHTEDLIKKFNLEKENLHIKVYKPRLDIENMEISKVLLYEKNDF